MEKVEQPDFGQGQVRRVQTLLREKRKGSSELTGRVLEGRFSAEYFFRKNVVTRHEYDAYLLTLQEHQGETRSAQQALQELRQGIFRQEEVVQGGYVPRFLQRARGIARKFFVTDTETHAVQVESSLQEKREGLTSELENYLPSLLDLVQRGKHASTTYERKEEGAFRELGRAQVAYEELLAVRETLSEGYRSIREEEQTYFQEHAAERTHQLVPTQAERNFEKAKRTVLDHLETVTSAVESINDGIRSLSEQQKLACEYGERTRAITKRLVQVHQGVGQALQRTQLYNTMDQLPEEFFTKMDDIGKTIGEFYKVEGKTQNVTRRLLQTAQRPLPSPPPLMNEGLSLDERFDQLEQQYDQQQSS